MSGTPTASPHIGFYCSSTSWGGLEMNTVRYAQWMQEAGFPVTFFGVEDTPIARAVNAASLRFCPMARNRKYFDIGNAQRVARLFGEQGIDLAWFRDTRDFDLLGWVKRISRRPLKLLYQQAMQFGVSKKDLFHTLRFRPVDRWIATLEFLAEQVRHQTHFPHERIRVIPLGVDEQQLQLGAPDRSEARRSLGIPEDAWVAGIVGRIDPLKDQATAINALQLIADKHPRICVMIAGESTRNEGQSYASSLRRRVDQLGLNNRVFFLPYRSDIAVCYRAMDAFVLTSVGETFGTVTIEAMSFALPIIGTDSSGTPEILEQGRCGLLFSPGDAYTLSDHLVSLCTDPSLAERIGAQARQRFLAEYSKTASVSRLAAEVRALYL